MPTSLVWCSSLVLVVTSESTWRLTHEGGNHAERKAELKKLKLDMGDARRDLDFFVTVYTILAPGAALLSSVSAGTVALFGPAYPGIMVAVYGIIGMSIMSLLKHAMQYMLLV